MNDNDNDTIAYFMERYPGNIHYGPLQIEDVRKNNTDESVLSDMELGIRRLQVANHAPDSRLTDEIISQVIPPFTRLQKLNEKNIQNMNSIYGIVASMTDKTVIYSPVPETGVITNVANKKVSLSLLNSNSGILEERYYPAKEIGLHKYRLLYYLGNVRLFRGVTGRICTVLSMKYVRELFICLFYYLGKSRVDPISRWTIAPDEIVLFLQYTYVAYMNSRILHPAKHNQVTLVSCLFKIFKNCVKQLCITSPSGKELLDLLKWDAWGHPSDMLGESHSISYRKADSLRQFRGHSGTVSSIQMTDDERGRYTVMSVHPVSGKAKWYDKVTIQGVAGLRVVFDRRCSLDAQYASLTFFRDDEHSEVIARFTGDSSAFCPFTVRGNTLRYLYESSSKAHAKWGYAFVIQPFEHVRWNGDVDVLEASCFDWSCFALNFVLEISQEGKQKDNAFFSQVLNRLIEYLRSSGMPFKSHVVELLIQLRSSGALDGVTLPDVSYVD